MLFHKSMVSLNKIKTNSWTIFGAGNFIFDVIEAIKLNSGKVEGIVLNQPLEKEVAKKLSGKVRLTKVAKFKPTSSFYFFGFIDPDKDGYLKSLQPYKLKFANLIHPFSSVSSSAKLGEGNFVGAGSIIGANTSLKNFNFVNRASSVGHDVKGGSFNHFGPGSTISGRCEIGDKNFFGSGSTIIDGLKIKDKVILGAGAVSIENLTRAGTYVGVPAKLLTKK